VALSAVEHLKHDVEFFCQEIQALSRNSSVGDSSGLQISEPLWRICSLSLFLPSVSEEREEIHIGCDYDSENDEEILPDDTFKSVASVCTDLWWYSIVDLAEFKKNNPDVDTSDFTIVKIPAGKWELSHKYGISEVGYHENLPYATLKKIG
jgi:hypothetical protein